MRSLKSLAAIALAGVALGMIAEPLAASEEAPTRAKQPNILVLWGDDVGITNISANSHGVMGYRTPNIDRVANEGMRFTDYYAEQSCTAGRASFILGQSVYRSGLSKVGRTRSGTRQKGQIEISLSSCLSKNKNSLSPRGERELLPSEPSWT